MLCIYSMISGVTLYECYAYNDQDSKFWLGTWIKGTLTSKTYDNIFLFCFKLTSQQFLECISLKFLPVFVSNIIMSSYKYIS